LRPEDLVRLIADGHALEVDGHVPASAVGPLCAAWVGLDFARSVEAENAPNLPFDLREMTKVAGVGWFLIDTPAAVFGSLDRWVRQTFVAAVDRRSFELAKLMSWAAPGRDEARAARFIAAEEDVGKHELEWWSATPGDLSRSTPFCSELMRCALEHFRNRLFPGKEAPDVKAGPSVALQALER
jgi:hypothetical protein